MRHLFQLLKNIIQSAHRSNGLVFFPFFQSARSYSPSYLRDDCKSAINVALLAFPQGMAYALIAGLPIHYGIIGSAIASIAIAATCPNTVTPASSGGSRAWHF